jgi:1-acyl-sn-glycerol-3-phosphate acyltransferase
LGVRLQVVGELPATGPLLVVSNHLSWLDIFVINAACPCRFVAKADVKKWPVIGALVERSGTLFIERENRRDALRVVHRMAACLQAGERLAVFPEGTTSDGQEILPFHANLLQAAVTTDSPILPVGVSYRRANHKALHGVQLRHDAPVYIGDTSLLTSLWRTASASDLQAVVCWGEPEIAQGRDRRTWAEGLRVQVARLTQ